MRIAAQTRESAIIGSLLGGTVGDAVGLAVEGLSPARQRKLFGVIDGPRLCGHRGMVSDDTEHAVLIARALIASGGEPDAFLRQFARELRGWILRLPAGVGWATLRSGLRLVLGVSPTHSGVFSAGNGPAMRAALVGLCARDIDHLLALVRASTRITHTDPKAEQAALTVALAAHLSAQSSLTGEDLLRTVTPLLGTDNELLELLHQAAAHVASGSTTPAFAQSLGLMSGVSGYAFHTVPVAIHAALRHPTDVRQAILSGVACGGDTDTTAAIVGGIVGAGTGPKGIPADWLASLWEWPQNIAYLSRLGAMLARTMQTTQPTIPPGVPLAAVVVRNAVFTAVVLAHGFRRLLPPY